jgi:hypothetical protein
MEPLAPARGIDGAPLPKCGSLLDHDPSRSALVLRAASFIERIVARVLYQSTQPRPIAQDVEQKHFSGRFLSLAAGQFLAARWLEEGAVFRSAEPNFL